MRNVKPSKLGLLKGRIRHSVVLGTLLSLGLSPAVWGREPLVIPSAVRCLSAPYRISLLSKGYASSVVQDLTPNCPEAIYIVAAQTGQRLVLILKSPGILKVEMTAPDGTRTEGAGSQAGVVVNQVLSQTGDYRIRVFQGETASRWKGQILLTTVLHPAP